jgi:hypothetical protein
MSFPTFRFSSPVSAFLGEERRFDAHSTEEDALAKTLVWDRQGESKKVCP